MIPQRIALKGFLCYRDRQEVSFSGASLWMLAGPNGSGKSTLFDAVTYALFGHHRAGQRHARELINKQADGLEVEYDFLLDGQAYQARRTVRRSSNRSTRQIRRQLSTSEWEDVVDTDHEEGFNRWVHENIGMNYETFTSSVLLLQGKAEKLLDADPRDRRKVAAGIVGLARFEKLHERADQQRKHFQTEMAVLNNQLRGVEIVSPEELKRIETQVETTRIELNAAREEIKRLGSLSLAIPDLRRLNRDRDNLLRLNEEEQRSLLTESQSAHEWKQARTALSVARTAAQELRERLLVEERTVAGCRALQGELRNSLSQLNNLSGKKTCSWCGQSLTPEHLQAERERLRLREESLQQEFRAAESVRTQIAIEEKAAREQVTGLDVQCARFEQHRITRQKERELRRKETARTVQECNMIYRQLPEPYRSRVAPSLPDDWSVTTYPTEAELAELLRSEGGDSLDIDQRMQRLQHRIDLLTQDLTGAERLHHQMVDRRDRRATLESQCLKAAEKHQHYQLLAELLGPKKLQLQLLREAERAITSYANAILDRLSSGQLFLKLRGEDENESADRALDLEAIDRNSAGTQPIDVRLLSGSQRFRVAVSLALGIGQYAGRKHRAVETVIIDEGFGCLDREGRQAMIQELQSLRDHLRCILLVSHQEEFSDAFHAGYRFESAEGTTKVTRFQR